MAKGIVFESARDDAFGLRIKRSQTFEERIFSDLDSWGFIYAINGTEHTHSEFVGKIKDSTDPTSLSIRFQPDGVFTFGDGESARSGYVEAKDSVFIERLAYENYMRLHNSGYRVYTVFCDSNGGNGNPTIKFCRVDLLAFKYKTPNSKNWPVIDGWLSPRSDPQYKQKIIGWHGSGTDHRMVDMKKLYAWHRFKEIKNTLSK